VQVKINKAVHGESDQGCKPPCPNAFAEHIAFLSPAPVCIPEKDQGNAYAQQESDYAGIR